MIKKVTFFTFIIFSLLITPTFAKYDDFDLNENLNDDLNDLRLLKNDLLKEKQNDVAKNDEKTYTVEKGDTLYRIAKENNIELEDLFEWNELESDLIYPGDELVLYEDEENKNEVKKEVKEEVKKEVNENKKVANNHTEKSKSVEKSEKVTTASEAEPESGKELVVTATAYTAYCNGCSGTTAYGIDLRSNPNQKVIAVDPSIIPLGTKVWVEGYGVAIAGDTGGAIKGHKIDVFIPTYEDAMEWGVKKIKIKILE